MAFSALPRRWHDSRSRWAGFSTPRDFLPACVIGLAVLGVCLVFGLMFYDVVAGGWPLLSADFLLATPSDYGRAGGIAPILVSTGMILLVCLLTAVPIGLGCAVWLAEYEEESGVLVRLVRRSLDLLAAMPSIVFGLFGYALFCQALGLGFSILSGGLTLACMVLPVLIRAVEVALRAVPDEIRAASLALGFSKTAAIRRLILPAAAPGLVVGVILGIARALAETAALLFTSGYVTRMPGAFTDSGRALSVHVYDLSMNVPGGDGAAYASALILLALLIVINTLATAWVQHWQRRKGWISI